MVADHASEPAALVALVGEIVAHIGGGGHAYRQFAWVAPCVRRRFSHRAYRPFGEGSVGQLQDEAVGFLAAELEGFRAVCRHPGFQFAAVRPRELLLGAQIIHFFASGQASQHIHRLAHFAQGAGLAADDSHSRVAPADAADRAIAEHVVEGGEAGGQHCPVSCARVCNHRADCHLLRGRQHLRVDHERLLPQHMGVKCPSVAEALLLGGFCQLHHPPSRRVGLQNYAEIHWCLALSLGLPSLPQRVCGNPRLIVLVAGSGQRDDTTLALV